MNIFPTGLVYQERACSNVAPCPEYKWSIDSSWSRCATPNQACGTGIVTREIHCKMTDKIVDPGKQYCQ